jgi:hypothetical protein
MTRKEGYQRNRKDRACCVASCREWRESAGIADQRRRMGNRIDAGKVPHESNYPERGMTIHDICLHGPEADTIP